MAEMMTGGTALVLLVFYMILALVIYHKVFVVFYFDLFNGLIRELVFAFIFASIMAGLTLMKWKIAAVIILIIALIIILKCQDNGKRLMVGIFAAIVIGFVIYSGLNFSKKMDEDAAADKKEEMQVRNNEYARIKQREIKQTPEPEPQWESEQESSSYITEDEEKDIDDAGENNISNGEISEAEAMEETESSDSPSEYILPDSSTKLLKAKEVKDLSKAQCRLAKNEIYARHGRLFLDESLQNYFDKQSWYNGYIEPEDFDEGVLSKTEKKNVKLLAKYEKEK